MITLRFSSCLLRFAESSSDEWQAPKTGKSGLVLGFGIADHPAENEEMFIGHVNMGRHIGLGRADPIDLSIAIASGHCRGFL